MDPNSVFKYLLLFIGILKCPVWSFYCPSECLCVREEMALCNGSSLTSIPHNLSHKLEDLRIVRTKLSKIRQGDLKNYPRLRSLNFDRNQIDMIDHYAFRDLPNLKIIQIRNNPLKKLKRFSFSEIHADENRPLVVYLDNNEIEHIDRHVFFDSRNFRVIDLSNNPIRTIEHHAFTGLYNIHKLDLSSGVHHIEQDAFHNLSRAHQIYISHWHAAKAVGVVANTFRGLRHSSRIIIKESDLGNVHGEAFAGMHTIQSIQFKDCNINIMKQTAFTGIINVGFIKFDSCKFAKLERGFFEQILFADSIVSLEDNWISCDCENTWMIDPFYNISKQILRRNYCSYPPNVNNTALIMLNNSYANKCVRQRISPFLPLSSSESRNVSSISSAVCLYREFGCFYASFVQFIIIFLVYFQSK